MGPGWNRMGQLSPSVNHIFHTQAFPHSSIPIPYPILTISHFLHHTLHTLHTPSSLSHPIHPLLLTMDPRVRHLYKTLLYMGKDYPPSLGGYHKFKRVIKSKFQTTPINNHTDMINALNQGEYIIKELEAFYYLSKYRYLKRRYNNN